jgi:glycolate oxidase iron-sulfur subunit
MLENERAPDEKTVKHIDRCLSCLACMAAPACLVATHLVGSRSREYIENTYKRPLSDHRMLKHPWQKILPLSDAVSCGAFWCQNHDPCATGCRTHGCKAMLKWVQFIPPVRVTQRRPANVSSRQEMRVALQMTAVQ